MGDVSALIKGHPLGVAFFVARHRLGVPPDAAGAVTLGRQFGSSVKENGDEIGLRVGKINRLPFSSPFS